MKYLLFFILIISSSNASMLLTKENCCIEDFYHSNGTFYYLKSNTGQWNTTTTNDYAFYILKGYDYNSTDDTCRPNSKNVLASSLGIDYSTFNMLMALSAILAFSIIIFYLTSFLIGF
jgi:hypothetical protein